MIYGLERLDRWEELVEIERQRVELFTPRIGLVRPELVPPMHASILPCRVVLGGEAQVQNQSQQSTHKCLRREGHVDHVVELHKHPCLASNAYAGNQPIEQNE